MPGFIHPAQNTAGLGQVEEIKGVLRVQGGGPAEGRHGLLMVAGAGQGIAQPVGVRGGTFRPERFGLAIGGNSRLDVAQGDEQVPRQEMVGRLGGVYLQAPGRQPDGAPDAHAR